MSEDRRYMYIVVSHTHWDREWYLPHQKFRIELVKLMDGLLDTLARDADFRCFMLDGQTVLVEDYLEIRPEKEGALKTYVRDGRVLIGRGTPSPTSSS